MPIAFEVLAAHLLSDARAILEAWFPKGRRQGREWCIGSLEGQPGQSLKINIDSGRWSDFATGQKGGDLISLYAAMRGVSQSDAAHQLGALHETASPSPPLNGHARQIPYEPTVEATPEVLVPPPSNASYDLRAFRHPKHGVPAVRYIYRDAIGAPLYVVARYEGSEGKNFCPWTWGTNRRGDLGWVMKMAPKPRPLYGLAALATLTRRVVVVEGEKAADALQGIVRLSPVVTWSAGAVNWRYADWAPLAGRSVLLWPDADPPGVDAMAGVAGRLLALGCSVSRIDVEGLPDGYDAANLIEAGITPTDLNQWIKSRAVPVTRDTPKPPEPQRVSAPEAIDAVTTPPEDSEPSPHADGEVPKNVRSSPPPRQPGYLASQNYGLKIGPRGPHVNLSNVHKLIAGLINDKTFPSVWWDSFLSQIRTQTGEWLERDTLALTAFVQDQFDFEKIGREAVDQAVALYAWQHQKNCAQEWLLSLKWDGSERLHLLLPLGFGAVHNDYNDAVGRCFMMGMVARVLNPGCQVDNLPVFEGDQGITKSQALRALGGEWYTETMESVTTKDFYLALAGKMLVEVAEFSSFKRAEAEAIKAAISRPTDRYRVPYERRPADHPRSCVFAATTNEQEWNLDPTGARRFWPVRCGAISVQWIREFREQLFAEAVARVRRVPFTADANTRLDAGAAWWDVPRTLARDEQDMRYQSDTIATGMRGYLKAERESFTILDVVTFGLGFEGPQRYDRAVQSRVRAQLIQWGYRSEVRTLEGGQKDRVWFHPSKRNPRRE